METKTIKRTNESVHHYQILTAFTLKLLGIILMVCDHIYQMFSMFGAPIWLHYIGRIVLPIFLFMASEGFHHTRNKKRYMLRLLCGFWLMGIANLLLGIYLPITGVELTNNVFGTMFLSVFCMNAVDTIIAGFRKKKMGWVFLGFIELLLPFLLYGIYIIVIGMGNLTLFRIMVLTLPTAMTVEGGFAAVLLSLAFYLLRKNRWLQLLPLILLSILVGLSGGGFQWMMIFAAIPILLYNGQPGRKSKYFFYIFYPAHIYLFYLISYFLH